MVQLTAPARRGGGGAAKGLIASDDFSIQMLMALRKIYVALQAYSTGTSMCSESLLGFAIVLAGIPDHETHYDDGHSTSDEAHQQSSHINFLPLILSCKYWGGE